MHYKLLVFQRTPIDNMLGYLQSVGFIIDKADEANVISKIDAKNYDACLLDAMAESDDRYSLVKRVRKANQNAAVVFLTKHIATDDAINCFEAGADDYIHTPYDIRELVCRLNAVLKRSGKSSSGDNYAIGKYTFNPKARILSIDGEETKLTEREAKLLALLSEYRNTILPRSVALKSIWFDDNVFNGRSMDVYITRLRKYLAKDPAITITSIRSQGFALVVE